MCDKSSENTSNVKLRMIERKIFDERFISELYFIKQSFSSNIIKYRFYRCVKLGKNLSNIA